jgi:hypothetical protein
MKRYPFHGWQQILPQHGIRQSLYRFSFCSYHWSIARELKHWLALIAHSQGVCARQLVGMPKRSGLRKKLMQYWRSVSH